MSATPGPAPPSPDPTPSTSQESVQPTIEAVDRLVFDYLRNRGFRVPEQAVPDGVEGASPDDKGKAPELPPPQTISSEELIRRLAVFSQKPTQPGENALKDSANVLQELSSAGGSINIQNLIASIGSIGAEEILSSDPTDKTEGFRDLEAWVDGSLDMYRPEFRPILFPVFVHFYLDLIQSGFKEAAVRFFSEFSPSLAAAHNSTLHHLSTLLLPAHVQNDELAQRFRNEKYVIRMSRSGFSLLIGWLTEGIGGEDMGSGEGFSGEKGKRGRSAVMRVVNNHLKFDVTTSSTTTVSPTAWEENTGLLSSLIPRTNGTGPTHTNAQAFNSAQGQLKLGPAPMSEELRNETERVLQEKALVEHDPSAQYDIHYTRPQPPPGVVAPSLSDLPPHPPTFKSIDVQREVERVRDAKKRIRLEPSALNNIDPNSPQAANVMARALPSICCYTIHDAPEGVPSCTFSPDSTLMAAGFAESYIRLWNLRGEKLKGMRTNNLRKLKERGGSATRKLIGHSGPVYSLSFDPLSGSAAPPKYLLSSSADATVRLWSMDTLTNVVAYRGHQNPVWDVQWSPMGIYFATASRDRTARLWSTDRASALRIYAGHLSDVDAVRFHPNSLYLATASSDWTARLWDVQRGNCVRVFIGHQGIVSTLAFSPDGRYLASAGEDNAINLWDLGSGRRVKKMTGHTASIYSLAFSTESSLLVSGGADWTVRCWDVKGAGGLPGKRENGMVNGTATPKSREEEGIETTDLVSTFPTKRTPIINVQFTPRNLCLAAGPYLPPDPR
ncbi:WD40 repeat-like protein [Gloeophyllum trabeum ATCC 11539]|uniref:WD40 repeat-like protein n=1 Tax=Gloeophyllum trabeum (strain ATCC 11539 / FP-39264 / Madison 617) TaxID=670483 RepID=S7QM64_GLOTA|nr:WD40 repeat-like protein [Gloeophyllum trabeum ATCC 11539]EPQ60553.1 WD40 repeat-like protein [Gloeophyllum trabeum ATCC 11539]